jgi:hypothetical protein
MRLPSLKFVAVVLTACAIAGFASSSARAEFVSGFTGNSQMSDAFVSGGDAGIVSFAVFHNGSGGSWVDALASALGQTSASLNVQNFVVGGGGSIDFGAKYVYMYQATNIGAANIDAMKVNINASGVTFTSAGLFLQQVFQTTGGKDVLGTSDGGNPSVRGLGTLTGVDDVPDGTPSSSTGVVTGIVNNPNPGGSVWDASQSDLATGGDHTSPSFGPNVTVQWNGLTGGPGQWQPVAAGNTSSIVFLTSDIPPVYRTGKVEDGDHSDGDVPTAVTPEPGSLVLAGMGVLSLLGYHVRRRKLTAATVAA